MLKIGNNEYRNLQEQVAKNMEDIEKIKKAMPIPYNEYYKKEEINSKLSEIDSKITYLHRMELYSHDSEAEEDDFITIYFDFNSNKYEDYTLDSFKEAMSDYSKLNWYELNSGVRFEYDDHHASDKFPCITKSVRIYINNSNELEVEAFYWKWDYDSSIEGYTWIEDSTIFTPNKIREYH